MRRAVDYDVAVEGGELGAPVVAAAVGCYRGRSVLKAEIAVHVGGAVGMINIDLITLEVHIAEAQRYIAAAMNLHSVHVNLGRIACDGQRGIMHRKLHENVAFQVIDAIDWIKGTAVTFDYRVGKAK